MVIGFAFGVAALAAILFGTMPAWQVTSIPDVVSRIREESGSTTSDPRRRRTRSALIVAETMLAVVLLVGAGLLTRSFTRAGWRAGCCDRSYSKSRRPMR